MPILIRWCLALCVLVCSGAAQAAGRLLWVTADITPAARTAQVESEGQRLGWQVQHLQWPLQGPAEPEGPQRQHWRAALAQADQVWVDMPHATVQARLQRVLEPLLAAAPHLSMEELELQLVRQVEPVRLLSRLSPMLGLIATMIPLGPALQSVAAGNGQQALAVFSGAFAGVVLALAAASVGLVVYSVRRRWLLAELLVVRKERGVAQ